MACDKCNALKGNIVTKIVNKITNNIPIVSLGRGTLYMSKMNEEIKAASAIWGFPCIYYIGNKLEPMEYQFISCCPICGEKLVESNKEANLKMAKNCLKVTVEHIVDS